MRRPPIGIARGHYRDRPRCSFRAIANLLNLLSKSSAHISHLPHGKHSRWILSGPCSHPRRMGSSPRAEEGSGLPLDPSYYQCTYVQRQEEAAQSTPAQPRHANVVEVDQTTSSSSNTWLSGVRQSIKLLVLLVLLVLTIFSL